MGKAGSKVLREASVDGIQAQVQAASSHTDMQTKADSHTRKYAQPELRDTHTKSVHQLKKRYLTVTALG